MMDWLLTGELRPCCWDSARSWPGIGLYDCGCLPSTLRWQLNCAYFLGFLCHLSPYENTGTSVSELADSYSWCLPWVVFKTVHKIWGKNLTFVLCPRPTMYYFVLSSHNCNSLFTGLFQVAVTQFNSTYLLIKHHLLSGLLNTQTQEQHSSFH